VIFEARCYTDLSVISTCIHGKTPTPLSRFVVDAYVIHTRLQRTNTPEIELMKLETKCISIERCKCDKQRSVVDGIVVLS